MKKKWILLLTLALCMSVLAGCGSKSVKLNLGDYVTIQYAGTNEHGTASASFDAYSFERDYMLAADDSKSSGDVLVEMTMLENSISVELDQSEGLKNGDTVKATVTYDKDVAKKIKLSVGGDSASVKVEGLVEPIYLDAFEPGFFNTDDGVRVVLDGTCPYAKLYCANKASSLDPRSHIRYEVTPSSDFAPGDTLLITASLDLAEPYALSQTSIEYTVPTNVKHYITSASELTDEMISQLLGIVEENMSNDFCKGVYHVFQGGQYTDNSLWESTMNPRSAGSVLLALRKPDAPNYRNAEYYPTTSNYLLFPMRADLRKSMSYDRTASYTDVLVLGSFKNVGLTETGELFYTGYNEAQTMFYTESDLMDFIQIESTLSDEQFTRLGTYIFDVTQLPLS